MIFPLCVSEGGVNKYKIYMSRCQTMQICDVSKPSANVCIYHVCVGAKRGIFMDFCNVSKSSAYIWNILQAKSWLFLVTRGGGNFEIDL